MGRGIISELTASLGEVGAKHTDTRKESPNLRFSTADGLKSAFSVFYFQHPSILQFNTAMKQDWKRQNVKNFFRIAEIPSDNEIRTLIDGVEPLEMSDVFGGMLKELDGRGGLEQFRVLDNGVLLALDGTWYHSSNKIRCKHCLHKTKDGITTYYHTILAGTIVKPGVSVVLPVMGEMITNEDGSEKQDCEQNAAKRWLAAHAEEYRWLKPTLLGDDLFSRNDFCREVLAQGMSFLFTCKAESHPWLSETVENSILDTMSSEQWDSRSGHHIIYTYRWLSDVEMRDTKDALRVNYLEMEIRHRETGKITYKNSWVTDKPVSKENAAHIAACARARWKIENEHNNVLKNHGYNLEHNFGHGDNHASEIFCLLNLLAFLIHGIEALTHEDYINARIKAGRRDEFFNKLRIVLEYFVFDDWDAFIAFVLNGPKGG